MSEVFATSDLSHKDEERSRRIGATISRNIGASLARVAAVSAAALVLPAYLTHRLPVTTYAAWILILQLGAYVSYLDLGIQTGISKFVAEYDAKGDYAEAGRHASAGFALMVLAGILGLSLTLVLSWQVPRLFSTMPAPLYHDVHISVIFVGASLSFGLVCSVYSAVFLGLQRYWIPTVVTIVNRVSYAAIILIVVALHGNLTAMGIAVAVINVVTGLLQLGAWQQKASGIGVSIALIEWAVLTKVARYCSALSLWTVGMLCVTGLDVTIVGHYDYVQTAYYSIATLPTNFLLLIFGATMGPLLPASSALSTHLSPTEMGAFLSRVTRYATVILLLIGLPLIVCGFPILRLWVGSVYALHTLRYLRVLVFANVIRNLCAPYATMICATGRQESAIVSVVAESAVNLGSSIYLASRFGAIGVAFGTLIGSFVSVSLHFCITMRLTRQTIAISRRRLFVRGLLRPMIIGIPSLVFLPYWWSSMSTGLSFRPVVIWCLSTMFFAWFGGLTGKDRHDFFSSLKNRFLSQLNTGQ